MHDSMPGRTIDEIKIWTTRGRSEECVFVWAHFVQTCPAQFWIDADMRQTGNAPFGDSQRFVEPGCFDAGVERIIGMTRGRAQEHDAPVAYAEVKPIGHENREGHIVGQKRARFGQGDLASQGHDGQVDSRELTYVLGPGASGIDDCAGFDGQTVFGEQRMNVAGRGLVETGDCRVEHEAYAKTVRGFQIPAQNIQRPNETIGLAKRTPDDPLRIDEGVFLEDLLGIKNKRFFESRVSLNASSSNQIVVFFGTRGDPQITHGSITRIDARFIGKTEQSIAREQ